MRQVKQCGAPMSNRRDDDLCAPVPSLCQDAPLTADRGLAELERIQLDAVNIVDSIERAIGTDAAPCSPSPEYGTHILGRLHAQCSRANDIRCALGRIHSALGINPD